MKNVVFSHSRAVMTCREAHEYEKSLLDTEEKAWEAMRSVGRALGRGILEEYRFSRYPLDRLKILGLVGKGHNGGDALLGIAEIVRQGLAKKVVLALADGRPSLRPNTRKSLQALERRIESGSLEVVDCRELWERAGESFTADAAFLDEEYDVCVDGLVGMQFRPPLRSPAKELASSINRSSKIKFRVAVDVPSGIGDETDTDAFMADVTFATGIAKRPAVEPENGLAVGSVRYLDVGLVEGRRESSVNMRMLTDSILDGLRMRRPANVEKRRFGHLCIIAGSRNMPGALLMCVKSALKSGVGLVTVCAPESLAPHLAPFAPEAMWIPWPETASGGLASGGLNRFESIQPKATALLVGPGMGGDVDTVKMMIELFKRWTGATVVDADALQPRVLNWIQGPCVATPHLGEFRRMVQMERGNAIIENRLRGFAKEHSIVVALKGPTTRISDGESIFLSSVGNPVLSRGGSGDILAGMTGALLAQSPQDPLSAACQAAYWHGRAGDILAARKGQVAVATTELMDCFSAALETRQEAYDAQ